jgi:hypothetical protein
MWFGPGPFRDQVTSWAEVVQAGLTALRTAAADTGGEEVPGLLRRAEAHAQEAAMPEAGTGSSPVACPVFQLNGQTVRTISAVMRFDTAVEITTSQLRIELMFPPTTPPKRSSAPTARRGHPAGQVPRPCRSPDHRRLARNAAAPPAQARVASPRWSRTSMTL